MSSMEREDWETFLDNNYHPLSRRIRVENLMTRLRSDGVISQDDQEMILNKYLTHFLRAGHLLDIVKTKGKNGFVKFMEAVEFEYPDVYLETTGVEPRPNPDRASNRRPGVTSTLLFDKMSDVIHTFGILISKKQSELKQFEGLVQQLKTDLEKQMDEQKFNEERIRRLEETIQELRDEKKELMESLAKERRMREEVKEKYDQLRNKNLNEFYDLSRQSIRQCVSLDPKMKAPVSSTISSPFLPSPPLGYRQSCAIKGTVKMRKDAYEAGKHTPCQPEAEVTPEGEKKTGCESGLTSTEVKILEETCCQLQESNDRLQCCIEEFKKDAEESRLKQLEAEALSRQAAAEKEQLKMEMRKMEAQFKLMADLIGRLKNEIDCRRSKSKEHFPIPIMFPESSSGGNDDESQFSPDARSPYMGAPLELVSAKPTLRPTKRYEKRVGFGAAPVTNILCQSSFDLVVNPLSSIDK